MTLYGVGLGPGDSGLVTVRGRRVLESADVVYSPGRLSRSVALEHVPEERIGELDFPMTRDEEKLRRAWKEAASTIAPIARDGDATFVTLGDPNVYSTFGHLRRTFDAFHPDVEVEIVPGVSAVTAFATVLGVEITAGSDLALREAAAGTSPTGPDRMVLFKVTDAPATHEGLVEAGYDVRYGRRLYMEGETIVTDDPEAIADRDYYTLAYAERGERDRPATAAFETGAADGDHGSDGSESAIPVDPADGGEPSEAKRTTEDRRSSGTERSEGSRSSSEAFSDGGRIERAEGCEHGDCHHTGGEGA